MKKKRTGFAVTANISGQRITSDPFESFAQASGYADETKRFRKGSRPRVIRL